MAQANFVASDATQASEAIFSIGSNCGDRHKNVRDGIAWLSTILDGIQCSTVYATPDCHGGVRKYMNAVAIGMTHLTSPELEHLCKQQELACGRDTTAREAGDVPLDIDVVVYDGKIMREKDFRSEFFIKGFSQLNHPHSATEI